MAGTAAMTKIRNHDLCFKVAAPSFKPEIKPRANSSERIIQLDEHKIASAPDRVFVPTG